MTKKSNELKQIRLSEKQAKHLERVMQNRTMAEAALAKAQEDEANVLDLICDAHNISLVNGIRYENGMLIVPTSGE